MQVEYADTAVSSIELGGNPNC